MEVHLIEITYMRTRTAESNNVGMNLTAPLETSPVALKATLMASLQVLKVIARGTPNCALIFGWLRKVSIQLSCG